MDADERGWKSSPFIRVHPRSYAFIRVHPRASVFPIFFSVQLRILRGESSPHFHPALTHERLELVRADG
jgi:hypothetical protein